MKVALCISGHARCLNYTIDSIRKYFLDVFPCDVYVHIWNNIYYRQLSISKQITVGRNEIDAINILNPRELVIQKPSHLDIDQRFSSPPQDTYLTNCPAPEDIPGDMYHKIKTTWLDRKIGHPDDPLYSTAMYYKIWKCHQLVEQSGVDYDLEIRLRFDLQFFDYMPQHVIDDSSKIWIPKPSTDPFGRYTDQFAVSSVSNMKNYSEIYLGLANPPYISPSKNITPIGAEDTIMVWKSISPIPIREMPTLYNMIRPASEDCLLFHSKLYHKKEDEIR